MSVADKFMLCEVAIVVSVNDELRNVAQMGHSRYRSFANLINTADPDLERNRLEEERRKLNRF